MSGKKCERVSDCCDDGVPLRVVCECCDTGVPLREENQVRSLRILIKNPIGFSWCTATVRGVRE